MGYCSHSQAEVNRLTAERQKYIDEKNNCYVLREQSVAIKEMLESYADSLRNIGYYLSFVEINNDSFDKGNCEVYAKELDNLANDIGSFIAQLDNAIAEYQNDIDDCTRRINNVPSICYSCQLAIAAAEEAARKAREAAASAAGGTNKTTTVAMVK